MQEQLPVKSLQHASGHFFRDDLQDYSVIDQTSQDHVREKYCDDRVRDSRTVAVQFHSPPYRALSLTLD